MDASTGLLIDWRLRWCRCYLDTHDFPYDRESIVLITVENHWHYYSEDWVGSGAHSPIDSIDYTLRIPQIRYSTAWHAAKMLAHNRRIKLLEKENDADFSRLSFAREWMLFGETWAEAKFSFDHLSDTLRGAKTLKSAKLGGISRKHALAENRNRILTKIQAFKEDHPAKGDNWAARQAYKAGFGASAEANRKLWSRYKK